MVLSLWSCSDSGEPLIKGCMNTNACNYSDENTHEDGSCSVEDCHGTCGGNAVADNCGVCDKDSTNDCDVDCNDEWGGEAVEDECGKCGGNNSSCVNYSTEIQPILSSNCTLCHGGAGGLTLTSYTNLISGAVVIAGNSQGSLLIKKLRGTAPLDRMPQGEDPLDESTINLIEIWIDEGARNN